MDERQKKAFDFAGELTKQVITLSTGVIAFTVTFNKDFLKIETPSRVAFWFLVLSWSFYLLSILFGIAALMFLTGKLGLGGSQPLEIYDAKVRWASGIQLATFFLATLFILIFGLVEASR